MNRSIKRIDIVCPIGTQLDPLNVYHSKRQDVSIDTVRPLINKSDLRSVASIDVGVRMVYEDDTEQRFIMPVTLRPSGKNIPASDRLNSWLSRKAGEFFDEVIGTIRYNISPANSGALLALVQELNTLRREDPSMDWSVYDLAT